MTPVSSQSEFAGRVAAITGAASGIGLACATRLVALGATVALIDRDAEAARVRADSLGTTAIGVDADVSKSTDLIAAIATTEATLGPVDILVCSAGVGGDSLHTVEVTDEEWKRVFSINCDGVFYANRAVLPGMVDRGYGRIVNIASIAGKEGNPMAAAYSASKAAVIGMTKSIGKDVAGSGVLVNAIAPAVIRTPILEQISQEHIKYMLERIPLGRMGEVDEVAELVSFLASDRLSFSTGAIYDISGGRATY
jgi:2-dehydro-3-deoxy-L-rhamnonate dehydrogenase (NAD+)